MENEVTIARGKRGGEFRPSRFRLWFSQCELLEFCGLLSLARCCQGWIGTRVFRMTFLGRRSFAMISRGFYGRRGWEIYDSFVVRRCQCLPKWNFQASNALKNFYSEFPEVFYEFGNSGRWKKLLEVSKISIWSLIKFWNFKCVECVFEYCWATVWIYSWEIVRSLKFLDISDILRALGLLNVSKTLKIFHHGLEGLKIFHGVRLLGKSLKFL